MVEHRRAKAGRHRDDAGRAASIELVIDAIGARGDGQAQHAGERYFVPFTVPGDRVRVRPMGRRGDGIAAVVETVLSPGPDRAAPPCPWFGRCGGCALQHLEDARYGDWKRDQVAIALARVGLAAVAVAPVTRTQAGTRRRATLAAVRGGDDVSLGFNERLSHRLVDLDRCPVLDPAIVGLLPALRAVLRQVLAPRRQVDITVTLLDTGLDLVLTGGLADHVGSGDGGGPGLAAREALADFANAADLVRLSWRRGITAAIEPLAHRRPALVRFGEVLVSPPPGGFLQASRAGEAALAAAVGAATAGAGRIADLFAGCGSFSFRQAPGATVLAVEQDPAAVAAVNAAAPGAAGPRVTAQCRDLDTTPLSTAELARFEAVILDPPRAGAAAQVAILAESAVPTIASVSCNPATFARDARILAASYELVSVQPVDQFVWSPHIELVGVFRRRR
ncbi:MAG: class I SAM-dependent RNA methyltransferase [Azospirillaceae bacterium]|nr:class I SAM-dependent RNA methyltransferase [Azospirillaceae bacterium]